MGHWNRLYLIRKAQGQALLELAIFGSLLIMLLGVLVNYGLRYNFQQRTMQKAFREALNLADPGRKAERSSNYITIQDSHIPSPSNPFGVGPTRDSIAAASIPAWSNQMDDLPTTQSDLPKIYVDINSQSLTVSNATRNYFYLAGFRNEYDVPEKSIDRYDEVYGYYSVEDTGPGACLGAWITTIDPTTGMNVTTCSKPSRNLKITDSCEGEILSYGPAVRQCRQIVDSDACIKECVRAKGSGCSSKCSEPMQVPWYCANYVEIDPINHKYTFAVLDQLFILTSGAKTAMGAQADYSKTTSVDNTLNKSETASGITAVDNLDWQVETKRKIVYRPLGDTSGNATTEEVISNVSSKDRVKAWAWNVTW